MSDISHFPLFSLQSVPTNFLCKQDKIEIALGVWQIDLATDSEAGFLIQKLGAPPPLYRNGKRLRLREGFGESNGWIFNRINFNTMPDEKFWKGPDARLNINKTVKVRTDPLEIYVEGSSPQLISPPLFGGNCHWNLEFVGGRTPYLLTCLLDLSINPTRFFFHQAAGHDDELKMQERDHWVKYPAPNGEMSWDGADNWIPKSGRLLRFAHRWWDHLARYLTGIESAFQNELTRAAGNAWRRPKIYYNVKKVETYAEFMADNPLAVVDQLRPSLISFSESGGTDRQYQNIQSGIEKKLSILRTQTAPGEHLKIYSKTNRRIRIEVTHNFRKNDRFQFPRRRATKVSSAHKFESIPDVIDFIKRLESQSIEVVKEFFAHAKRHGNRKGLQTPPYEALLHVRYCLPEDFDTARTLISMLIYHKRIVVPAKASPEFRDGVKSLLRGRIIEKGRGRMLYAATNRYKDAFAIMAAHSEWTET